MILLRSLRPLLAFAVGASVLSIPGCSSAQRSSAAAKGSTKPVVAHPLMDQAWGLPWGTIKLPTGWGFNGGVVHAGFKGCVAIGDSPMWTAESPDKGAGVSILPELKTNWTTDPQMARAMQQGGCPMVQADSAADYLTRYILPHVHQKFQVLEVGTEPMFAQGLAQMQQQIAQQNQRSQGNPYSQMRSHVDTARVLVSYEDNGKIQHEMASAMVSCTETRMQFGGQRPTLTVECVGLIGALFHGVDDGTPFTLAALSRIKPDQDAGFFTIEPNPAWQQRFNQESQRTARNMQAENQANMASTRPTIDNGNSEAAKRAAIIKGTADYSRDVHSRVYQNQRAASDQVAGATAAHMGDYNVYTNPNTGRQVQLSNQYNNTYVNENGNAALQTNSANSPGVNWTLMTPKY